MSETNNRGVYTVEEVQEKLGIGRRQAYELASSGSFPAKRMGKRILIPKRTFEEWLYS